MAGQEQRRTVPFARLAEEFDRLAGMVGVERGRGLVGEDQGGLGRERPRDGDPDAAR